MPGASTILVCMALAFLIVRWINILMRTIREELEAAMENYDDDADSN